MTLPKPYYKDDWATIYHGDCREILPLLQKVDLVLTDPPYGIRYKSGYDSVLPREIKGDHNSELRDWLVGVLEDTPALVFGTWKVPVPDTCKMVLVWDTQGALGMGDLSLPWKPSHQQIYVFGRGFCGYRSNDVLSFHPAQSTALRGRVHPHEKPVDLIRELIGKCPPGTILDPFMGSGTTLRAAKDLGRHSIGIEIEERYCEIAAKRLAQETLRFDPPPPPPEQLCLG